MNLFVSNGFNEVAHIRHMIKAEFLNFDTVPCENSLRSDAISLRV